jgi:hypothetical protein
MSKVTSVEVKKTGQGPKGPWTLYNITVDDNESKYISGFDKVEVGDTVEVSSVQNGEYTNWNYKKPKASKGSTAAPSAGGAADPRTLKLLVVIAEQVGVEKETVLSILEGKE